MFIKLTSFPDRNPVAIDADRISTLEAVPEHEYYDREEHEYKFAPATIVRSVHFESYPVVESVDEILKAMQAEIVVVGARL